MSEFQKELEDVGEENIVCTESAPDTIVSTNQNTIVNTVDEDEDEERRVYSDKQSILASSNSASTEINEVKLNYYNNLTDVNNNNSANSSDDEDNNNQYHTTDNFTSLTNNATDGESSSDIEVAGMNEYEVLNEDFGDFVSNVLGYTETFKTNSQNGINEAEIDGNFADFINPTGMFRKKRVEGSEVAADDVDDDGVDINENYLTTKAEATSKLNISIPPLSQDKINQIKSAMSKITIKMPGLGSSALADMIVDSKLRIGDEVTKDE